MVAIVLESGKNARVTLRYLKTEISLSLLIQYREDVLATKGKKPGMGKAKRPRNAARASGGNILAMVQSRGGHKAGVREARAQAHRQKTD